MKRFFVPAAAATFAAAASLLVAALFAGGDAPGAPAAAWAANEPPSDSEIALVYGVGGVLTRDGTLWQFRPDLDRWFTIDEAFRQEGGETRIMPLPVPVGEIAEMFTCGFLVTKSGRLWLYEFSTNQWRQIAPPARG